MKSPLDDLQCRITILGLHEVWEQKAGKLKPFTLTHQA